MSVSYVNAGRIIAASSWTSSPKVLLRRRISAMRHAKTCMIRRLALASKNESNVRESSAMTYGLGHYM